MGINLYLVNAKISNSELGGRRVAEYCFSSNPITAQRVVYDKLIKESNSIVYEITAILVVPKEGLILE